MKFLNTKILLAIFLALVCIADLTSAACDVNDSWIPYRDQKCIKITNDFVPFEDAINVCESLELDDPDAPPATLLTIKTPREQVFIRNYIFSESGVEDSVWIGASRDNLTFPFLWVDDGTTLNETYANWAPGNPVAELERDCIEMRSNFTLTLLPEEEVNLDVDSEILAEGQWFNVPCTRRALVVCESLPSLNSYELKRSLNEAMRRLEKLEAFEFFEVVG